MRYSLPFLLAFVIANCSIVAEESTLPTTSPDGRFVFRFLSEEEAKDNHDGGFLVTEKKSGRTVLRAPEEAINSFTKEARVIFAPDSSHLALNFQAGSRYQTTFIYRWNGKQFVKIATPETALSGHLTTEKAKERKEAGIPGDAYERRIWDTWETRQWTGPNTAIVLGSSTRTYTKRGDDEPYELTVEFLFTVRFEKDGKMKQLKREKQAEPE